jgi:RNA polymerase sigma factor (TIGR02999 family)
VGSDPGITRLLRAWSNGEDAAMDRLAPLVYDELHRIAAQRMRAEKSGNTFQATALVNQAWLHFADGAKVAWQDRAHFFAVASRIMRRILVDAARARGAGKRRGSARHFQLNESIDAGAPRDAELIALDDALHSLARLDERKARVVEMRFFGGLSVEETAAVLRISPQSVMRDWKLARAWLQREISGASPSVRPERPR